MMPLKRSWKVGDMADNNDLFAPPTDKELKTFAAPTPEELKSAGQPTSELDNTQAEFAQGMEENLENVRDFATGAEQGLTFGGSDELIGGLQAAGKKVGETVGLSEDSGKSLPELYREYQQVQQDRIKKSQERSPTAFLTGDIAGSVGSGLLTAGAGTALRGAKIAKAGVEGAAKAAPVLKESLLSILRSQGGKAAGKELGKRTLIGGAKLAPLGAAEMALRSEGTLEENPEQIAKDAVAGGTFGLLFGGLGTAAAETGSAGLQKGKEIFGKYVDENNWMRQLKEAGKMGAEGKTLSDTLADKERIGMQQRSHVAGVADQLTGAETQLGQKIEEVITNAQAQGVVIDIGEDIRNVAGDLQSLFLSDPRVAELTSTKKILREIFAPLDANQIDPQTAYNVRKRIMQEVQGVQDPVVKKAAIDLADQIKAQLEANVPGLAEATKQFTNFRRAGSETLMSKGMRPEVKDVWLGDKANPRAEVETAVQDFLSSYAMPGDKSQQARTMRDFMDNLKTFDMENPGKLQELGFGDLSSFEKELVQKADEIAVGRQAMGYDPQSSNFSAKGAIFGSTTGRGKTLKVANVIGQAAGSETAAKARNLFNAPENVLRGVGEKLEQIPGVSKLGTALIEGLNNKNQSARNAALFVIMQNPDARQAIGELTFGEE